MQRALVIAAIVLSTGCGSSEESPAATCDPKVENGARISSRGAPYRVCVGATLELALDLWECTTAAEVTPYATWTSDRPAVATVDKGVVTGVSAGTVNITGEHSGRTDTHAVDVVACP